MYPGWAGSHAGRHPLFSPSPTSPPQPLLAKLQAGNGLGALCSHNPGSKAGGWRHSPATAAPKPAMNRSVARAQPQLPPRAGSSLITALFLAGKQEDAWAVHPKQVWPGQPVSLCHGPGAFHACSAAAEPVEAELPGARRQPQRAALPTQARSPSRRPARQPGERPRAGHGAQGKPGQGAGCAPTFSESWEPLGSAGKEAPWELCIGAQLHTVVPQTFCCPAKPPPAFLTGCPFIGK